MKKLYSTTIFSTVFIAVLLSNSTSFSKTDTRTSVCEEKAQVLGNINISQQASTGDCFISAYYFAGLDLKYRNFMWSSKGQLMVFNSFDDKESSTSHGARMFQFFPTSPATSDEFYYETQGDITTIYIGSFNLAFEIKHIDGRINKFSWGSFTEANEVRRDNFGGLELHQNYGIILDSGFALGQDPTARQKATSFFTNSKKQTCTFKNTELFKYNKSGDPTYKWNTEETFKLIANQCPDFEIK